MLIFERRGKGNLDMGNLGVHSLVKHQVLLVTEGRTMLCVVSRQDLRIWSPISPLLSKRNYLNHHCVKTHSLYFI